MLNNNNQIAVNRISKRSMKQNRVRNMFAILAIILTTFMFTTVFSIGFSLAKNMNVMTLRGQGTKSTIFLANPTEEQISQVNDCKYLNAAGINIHTGKAQSLDNSETVISLDYYDKTEFEENFIPAISDLKGNYPTNKMEIMLSKAALDALDIDNPKGQMDIHVTIDGKDEVFKLSGWFTDYRLRTGGFQGFVSKSYYENLGLTVEENGILSISAKIGSQGKLLNELDKSVTLEDNQEFESSFDVQDESISNSVIIAAAICLIGLIIVFSGYLLIYNVMYISVTKDIRFYGMLKTIGTSPRQIKKIVKMQAFRLSVIGIPVGIIFGTLVSFFAVPYALNMFGSSVSGAMPTDINFNPFIYIGTILFGIFTVAVSCRKPSKLASKVSPVEALKYNGQNSDKIRPKKSTDGGKLYKMAYRNVFREKKRALLVFASLFMGTMAFLSTNSFFSSMKLENYVDTYLPNDYNIYVHEDGEQTYIDAAHKLVDDISEINGIKNINVNRLADANILFDEDVFRPFLESDATSEEDIQGMIKLYSNENSDVKYSAPIIGIDKGMLERHNEKAKRKIDIERFEKGEICFVESVRTEEQAERVEGKNITLVNNKSGKKVSIEVGVCAILGDDYGINIGYYQQLGGAPSSILVSQSIIDELTDSPSINSIIIDCESKLENDVTAQIKELTKTNPSVLNVEIKSEMIKDFKTSMTSMSILTAGISIILIFIGIINFINVMLTGVFARRKELSVMESVGMTQKQVQKMLMMEGVYYGLITIILILTLGSGITYIVGQLSEVIADYAVFNYPWLLMIIIIAVIMSICVMVPALVYKTISKDSITERLRGGE